MTACRWRECACRGQNDNRCASRTFPPRTFPRDGNFRKTGINGHIVSASRPTNAPSRGSMPRTTTTSTGAAYTCQHHRPERVEQEENQRGPWATQYRTNMTMAKHQRPNKTAEQTRTRQYGSEHARPGQTMLGTLLTLAANFSSSAYGLVLCHRSLVFRSLIINISEYENLKNVRARPGYHFNP